MISGEKGQGVLIFFVLIVRLVLFIIGVSESEFTGLNLNRLHTSLGQRPRFSVEESIMYPPLKGANILNNTPKALP